MSELKPCPFCGSDNVVADNLRVRCNNGECLAILTSPLIGNKTLAKALWNSRPSRPTDHADLIRRARDYADGLYVGGANDTPKLLTELADALEQRDGLRERVEKIQQRLARGADTAMEMGCHSTVEGRLAMDLLAALRGKED